MQNIKHYYEAKARPERIGVIMRTQGRRSAEIPKVRHDMKIDNPLDSY